MYCAGMTISDDHVLLIVARLVLSTLVICVKWLVSTIHRHTWCVFCHFSFKILFANKMCLLV